ncbi:MAG: phosphoglucosamine mutase, partial [Gemmatimonadales bacterium]
GTRVRELAAGNSLQRANYNAIGGVEADSDAISRHLAAVLALRGVDVRAIKRRRFRVALDTVRGAGGVVMPELLQRLGCGVTAINLETDGLFPRPPEPVPENLKALGALVRRSKADVGIAVDPDVDRLAIVDEKGRPIGEDYTLAFAIRAVRPSARRPVVCNLSTSLVVEDAAKEFGAEVIRAPVGEAHVARKMIEVKALIGGEGNGGVMYPALHVGRDAPVAGALLLGLLARERVTVSELVASHPRYTIVKAKVPRGPRLEPVYDGLRRAFADAAVDTQDGLRLAWPDRWVHVRPSGTEPIIRLIAEAPTSADAERLIAEGRRLCAAS